MSVIESPLHGNLGWETVRGHYIPVSSDLGVGPYFSQILMDRIHHQQSTNVVFCGEPGISKSYSAIAFAEYLQSDFRPTQVVYTYSEFMHFQLKEPEGHICVMDEPEYISGCRSWYEDVQKSLVATARSARFRVHPLFVPTINRALIDKQIRKYLIQYMVWLDQRGCGTVYKISPSRFDESVAHIPLTEVRIEMLSVADCDDPWCLGCKKFEENSCHLFRAEYERRRKAIQLARYSQDLEDALEVESKEYSDKQLEEMLAKVHDKVRLTNRGTLDAHSIRMILEEQFNIKISLTKATNLSKIISMRRATVV